MQHGLKQAALSVSAVRVGLQLVAQCHQFIDLGDDAVLLGEGWKREGKCSAIVILMFDWPLDRCIL